MITEIRNSYWVVPGLIAAGPFPGALEVITYKIRLSTIFDTGIRAFINLQEPGEMSKSKYDFIEDYSQHFRIFLEKNSEKEVSGGLMRRFPITDKDVPSVELMKKILDEIDRLKTDGIPIYIHCWGGIGRTGTVVGCWLMRHSLAERNNVLDKIFDLRRFQVEPSCMAYNSPETEIQERFILNWKKED